MATLPAVPVPSIALDQSKEQNDNSSARDASPSPASSISHESSDSATAFKPGTRFYLAFLTLAVLTLMVALDGTSISVALPIIASKLHGTAIEAFWAGTSFLLCSTVFQPSFASFSHIFGRKPLVIAAILFFLVGSLIGATATNFTLLLSGRSLQGIGGGGIIALTEIVITDLVPLRLRGQWYGIISGMWSIGSVSGPIIGGVLSQKASWRWILYINLPFIGVGIVLVGLFLKLNFIPSSMASKLRRVDWIGTVIFVGSSTAFLLPITWGGVMYAWDSWRTLVPLLIGVAGLVGFVLYEAYVAREPLIPLDIFRNRTATISYAMTVLHGMILWCLLYYSPLYFEAVKGYTPIVSGVALLPETLTVAPTAVVTGILVTKTGKYRWAVIAGWILATLGAGLLILLDVTISVPRWVFIMLVSGVGMGMLFPAMQFSLQGATANKHLAFAVAMFSFFRAFGQAMGVAVGGVIFQNDMKRRLLAYPDLAPRAAELAKNAAGLVQIIKAMPEGSDKTDLQTAYAKSYQTIMIAVCVLAGAGLVISCFIKSYDLDRALETEQGFADKKRSKTAVAEEGKSGDESS